jgi:hypothetical protein
MFVMREQFYWTEYYITNIAPHYLEWFKKQVRRGTDCFGL